MFHVALSLACKVCILGQIIPCVTQPELGGIRNILDYELCSGRFGTVCVLNHMQTILKNRQ